MSEPTKAEQWVDNYYPSLQSVTRGLALEAYAAGQAETEASRPKAPTPLDIAKRLRDEFPGVHTQFGVAAEALESGLLEHVLRIWSPETGDIENCTSVDNAIALLRQARDGHANPADLPGADMEIDLAQPTD
jgi:hypothetical protein